MLAQVSTGSTLADVLIALIGAMGVIGVALVQTTRRAGRAAARTQDAIGTPNGEGNVVQMLERLLNGQTAQDTRLARLEARHIESSERLQRIESRLVSLETPTNGHRSTTE